MRFKSGIHLKFEIQLHTLYLINIIILFIQKEIHYSIAKWEKNEALCCILLIFDPNCVPYFFPVCMTPNEYV